MKQKKEVKINVFYFFLNLCNSCSNLASHSASHLQSSNRAIGRSRRLDLTPCHAAHILEAERSLCYSYWYWTCRYRSKWESASDESTKYALLKFRSLLTTQYRLYYKLSTNAEVWTMTCLDFNLTKPSYRYIKSFFLSTLTAEWY